MCIYIYHIIYKYCIYVLYIVYLMHILYDFGLFLLYMFYLWIDDSYVMLLNTILHVELAGASDPTSRSIT